VPAAAGSPGAVPAPTPETGIEARLIRGQLTALESETPNPGLKPEYSDKTSFLSDLQATRPSNAVDLDGKNVWSGFGPATRYHTNQNGSISR
jgi:hypothetical protein